jgi:hypothetical protein
MKITLESTTELVELVDPPKQFPAAAGGPGIQCRVWQGTTGAGIPIRALIALVAVDRTEDCAAFDRELRERFPRSDGPRIFPTRLVL